MPKNILISVIEKKITGEKKMIEVAEQLHRLISDLLLMQKLINLPKPKIYKITLKFEDPKLLYPDKLEFTSERKLRKLWKLRHKKRVKKGIKKANDGYIGS